MPKFIFSKTFPIFIFFFLYNNINSRIMIRTPEKLSSQFVSKKNNK